MTHTTYIVQKRVNNEWQQVAEFKIRALAVGHIVEDMSKKWDADPQDYKIVEKAITEEDALMDIANKIAKDMADFSCHLVVHSYLNDDGSGFVELREIKYQYPSLSRPVVQHIFELIDKFNAGLEGYEVLMSITYECAIRLILSKKENE